MAASLPEEITTFEKAWPNLQEGINKLIQHLESDEDDRNRQVYTSEDYMDLYTLCYSVCSPSPIGPEAQKLYDQYRKTFEDYISSKVLPSLRGKEDENLLREALSRWNNHKIMVHWLSRFFHYLDRYFVVQKQLPSLVQVGYLTYYNLVLEEFHDQIRNVIISLIDRKREGCQIDLTLVKEVMNIYKQLSELVGKGKIEQNVKDLEDAVIKSAVAFYSRNASSWIANMSHQDYMLKVGECLAQEKAVAFDYIKFISKDKLFEVVKHELLTMHGINI